MTQAFIFETLLIVVCIIPIFHSSEVHSRNEVFDLVTRYSQLHSRENFEVGIDGRINLKNNERHFISAGYSCPHQVGNRLHSFLNAAIAAIISNRTLLWHYCDEKHSCSIRSPYIKKRIKNKLKRSMNFVPDTIESCEQTWSRHSWIPSLSEVSGALKLNDINSTPRIVMYGNSNEAIVESTRFIVTNSASPIVDFNGLYERDMWDVFSNESNIMLLDPQARQRAKLLFSFGPEFVYGIILNISFTQTQTVIEVVKDQALKYIHPLQPTCVFGVHVRHINIKPVKSHTYLVDCLRHHLQTSSCVGQCVVLGASDRISTMSELKTSLEDINCTFLYIDSKAEVRGVELEHGSRSGVGAAYDLNLLSHATNGLVYSVYNGRPDYHSTFTMLAASMASVLVATAGGDRYRSWDCSPEL